MDWITTVGTFANVIVAAGTLWAAREAAKAAKGSEHASRAAERQIDVAESSRKIQILPYVVIHSIKEDSSWMSTWLVIENVGPGAAVNVRIEILEGIDYKYSTVPLSEYSPIKNGIKILPSGQKLDTILGSNLAVQVGVNEFLTQEFKFSVKYQDIEGKNYGRLSLNLRKDL